LQPHDLLGDRPTVTNAIRAQVSRRLAELCGLETTRVDIRGPRPCRHPAVRIANCVVAALLALALLVGGLLVAVEIVVAGFGRRPWVLPHDHWYRSARLRSWESAPPRWIFIALVAAGLGLLLLLQFARRRPVALPLTAGTAPADLGRRSLERSLTRAATGVDGISAARVKVDGQRGEVTVTTNRRQAGDLEPRVSAALERRVQALGLAHAPAVRVKVNARGDR